MHLRRTATLALVVTAALMGSALAQGKKPTVAVLGLEVIDDGGGIDAKSAKFATDLTDALRVRAKVGAGQFQLAPNSNKDLLEMKLLSGCDNEARGCMADIGKELGADRLIYGKVERKRNGFQVTLKLLHVPDKKMERSTTDLIGLDDMDTAALNRWSRRLYNRLTGLPDEGTLVVNANVDTGTVYVDGEVKGSLAGGTAQISGIPEGKHEVRVESQGRTPFSSEVQVKGGETYDVKAELVAAEAVDDTSTPTGPVDSSDDDDSRPGGGWRVAFWASAAVAVGGAGGATFFNLQKASFEEDKDAAIRQYQTASRTQLNLGDACADAETKISADPPMYVTELNAVKAACDDGKSKAMFASVSLGVSVASAVFAGYAYYKGYISAPKSGTESAQVRKGLNIELTPAVSVDYLGAGLRIDF